MAVVSPVMKARLTTLPRSGICNEVIGIFSEMLSWKTVSERRTVTPGTQ